MSGRRSTAALGLVAVDGSPAAEHAIEIDHVSHVYDTRDGGKVTALDDVSIRCAPGEFVSIIGPSGCGKSTLLRLLAGLAKPTSGHVRVRGREISGPSDDIAMVFQKPTLLPWRTVLENCLLPVQIRRLPVNDYREKALQLLKLTGLENFAGRYPNELSGGMQQRAAIARALVTNPAHLLFDEPFGALDALTRDRMAVELQSIWMEKKPSVLFVTHSIAEAIFLSDRVVVMSPRPGRVVKVLNVKLPRPRETSIYTDATFGRLVTEARMLLEES